MNPVLPLIAQKLRIKALLAACHPKQRLFVLDMSPRESACCSRRAGKSVGVLVKHAICAESYPGETSVYINRSVAAGLEVLGPALRGLERDGIYLGIRQRTLRGRTYWEFPNRHRIWIAGCSDRSEIDNFRGFPPPLATVDEAQQFAYLSELIEESLEPALLDHQGQLVLIGTPNPAPVGPFFEAVAGSDVSWSRHHWTIHDNTYLPNAAAWLESKRARLGWPESHPRYRREYLGEWVLDGDALVYPLTRQRNGWVPIPAGTRLRMLGVDLGSTGVTALVVVATVQDAPGYWVEHCECLRGASVSQVCEAVLRVRRDWDIATTVVDAGGLGGAYVDELQSRWSIPAQAATKTAKLAYIEHMRSDILAGLVHVSPDAQAVWDEAATLQWDDARKKYDDRMPDHALDALLYAWRELHPETEPVIEVVPAYGSAEWAADEQRKARAAREEHMKRVARQKRGW